MKVRLEPQKESVTGVSMIEVDSSVGSQHWYTSPKLKGKYVPSVSTILGLLKDGLEFVSAWDLKKAQERGIRLHKATEKLEEGQALDREYGRFLPGGFPFDDKEWLMLLGFQRWYLEYQPKALFIETPMADKKLGYGGTLDRIYDIGGRIVLVDIKTASAIYDKNWMQVAAYRELALKTKLIDRIDETAILRLSEKTKKGYQYEHKGVGPHGSDPSVLKDLAGFHHVLQAYQYLNPDAQPTILDLPDTIQLIVKE